MKRILFVGDSITDEGRSREDNAKRGWGYPTFVAAELGFEHPEEYEFINRGIAGNRITDLLARIKCDMINLQPDVMSILIGVNDVWHEFGSQNGVRSDLFEHLYNLLIRELKTALPDLRIMIMEPFALKASATEANWEAFRTETELRAAAAKRVAAQNGLEFIPLQEPLDKAAQLATADFWLRDGVHPTDAGHRLLAKAWIDQFSKK